MLVHFFLNSCIWKVCPKNLILIMLSNHFVSSSDCIFYLQQLQVMQINLQDETVIQTALRLGYHKEDLDPITIQSVVQISRSALLSLSEPQQKYYIDKKYQALLARRNKIIATVSQQMEKNKDYRQKKQFNPAIKKLLQDHQMRLQKKARYEERVRVSKTRDVQFRKISNTIDFGRTSPNFSNSAKQSQVSRQSNRSKKSMSSQFSNSSHKDRLQLVRLKQKEAERYKKNLFLHNEQDKQRKVERVHQSRLSLSRRLKTKSQISQQAAKERKLELKSLHHEEIRGHIQKLKYKMIKNEYIKERQQERRSKKDNEYDFQYKKQLKNMFEQNEKEQHRMRYEEKFKAVERNKHQIEKDKKKQVMTKIQEKQLKQMHVNKFRQHMFFEDEQRKKQIIYYGLSDIERAKNQKAELQSEKKMKLLQNRIKQEIAQSNYNSIQKRRAIESQTKGRKIQQKLKQIKDIEDIKRMLTQQKKRSASNRLQSSGIKKYLY